MNTDEQFDLQPVMVPQVHTKYRTIVTPLPVPESLPIFHSLEQTEPNSMMGQPPIVWHHADNCTIADQWGNRWLDWSSCVLVANIGHGRPEVKAALESIIDQGLLATYVTVTGMRMFRLTALYGRWLSKA